MLGVTEALGSMEKGESSVENHRTGPVCVYLQGQCSVFKHLQGVGIC